MTTYLKTLVAGAAFLVSLGLSPLGGAAPAHAGGPAAQDPCASPLPIELAATGGISRVSKLTGGGATLVLNQFGSRGLRDELRLLHVRALPHDAVAEFDFLLPRRAHIYFGPTHVFRHSGLQHVCRSGPVIVDLKESLPYGAQHTAMLRLEGTIVGSVVRIDVWVGGVRYQLSGRRGVWSPPHLAS